MTWGSRYDWWVSEVKRVMCDLEGDIKRPGVGFWPGPGLAK